MPVYYVHYDLHDGFVDHWLVGGPESTPIQSVGRIDEGDPALEITCRFFQADSGIAQAPVEDDPLRSDGTLAWRYYRCQADHLVDLTGYYHTAQYLRAWAYAQVHCPAPQEKMFVLGTYGPADVWVNGQHVYRTEHTHKQVSQTTPFSAALGQGRNDILLRIETVAVRERPFAAALRIVEPPKQAHISIPTHLEGIARRENLERTIYAAYLEAGVYTRDDAVVVRWPKDLRAACPLTMRVQTPSGRIYGEISPTIAAGDSTQMAFGAQLPDGPMQIVLMAPPTEHYEQGLRVQNKLDFHVLKNGFSHAPYGSYEERRLEALEDAARRDGDLYSEVAKMELGRWGWLDASAILSAVEKVKQRRDGSDVTLLGLLGMMLRYGDDPRFPVQVKRPVTECALGFRYDTNEPGEDTMDRWSEDHRILLHTCEILAGQLLRDQLFTVTGQTGVWHREQGECRALAWLAERAVGGLHDWDAQSSFEHDLLALSHLAGLAESVEVQDVATVMMDKLFYSLALNSFRGAFGSTHGRADVPSISSARLEPTSGICRLMWGMGAFNEHVRGSVSLACADAYELPAIISDIARDGVAPGQPTDIWSKERHAGASEQGPDRSLRSWEVNKVTFKTPDYMLSSAQDYRPGQPGAQEHIWQATMGPEAVVFVTHPPCMSEHDAHRPNFWRGNHILPRVAQWRDVLIALYRLSADDPVGFTHAYWPAHAFDEAVLHDHWALARKDSAYVALYAQGGLEFVRTGPSAYRELRSYGKRNAWLCHMGRAEQDGSWAEFQDRVLAIEVQCEEAARLTTLRGDELTFGWEGPLLVSGQVQAITGFWHYDSPYCVTDWSPSNSPGWSIDEPAVYMDIRFQDWMMRLNLARTMPG